MCFILTMSRLLQNLIKIFVGIFMKKKYIFLIFSCLLSFFILSQTPQAQAAKVNVGIHQQAPFVMQEQGGGYTGMAVELWSIVAQALHLESHFIEFETVDALIEATKKGEVDFIASSFTVTAERSQSLKYSYPWYDSGLRIMINLDNSGNTVLNELKRNGQLQVYLGLFVVILVLTVVITIVRRKVDPECPPRLHQQLSSSLHDLVLAAKSGAVKSSYMGWVGHLLAAAWMLFGVAIIAFVTSSVTTAMTTVALTHDIKSVYDLPGRKVAAIQGSAEERFLRDLGIYSVPFANANQAALALASGQVDAFVSDAPVLEYWANKKPESSVRVIGAIVKPEKFAFAANKAQADLVDRISTELIRLHEEDIVTELRLKYIGKPHH